MRALVVVALVGCASPEPRPRHAPHAPLAKPARSLPGAPTPFVVLDPSVKVVPLLSADAPSYRYGILDRDACEAELIRRGVAFDPGTAAGVDAPIRLRGALHGVTLHPIVGKRYQVFDCRLALALDDFAAIVAAHDVTEITYAYAYRPQSEYGCTARYRGLQHCGALAVDVREFAHRDGTRLAVARDFHGKLGLGTCAVGVGPTVRSAKADELWSFVCDAAERALFNVMLTPNYNREHENHFHLEITPEAGWMMVH